jgi:hypothetical protein
VTAIAAGPAVAARRTAIGTFGRNRFVITKVKVVGTEVTHARFGFDVGDPAFEPIGGAGFGFFGTAGRARDDVSRAVGVG